MKRARAIAAARLVQRRCEIVFVVLADRSEIRVNEPGERDHRIGRSVDRRLSAFKKRLANGHVTELGTIDQLIRQLCRRFLTEDLAHEGIVGAEHLAELRQRKGQRQLFKLGIERPIRQD